MIFIYPYQHVERMIERENMTERYNTWKTRLRLKNCIKPEDDFTLTRGGNRLVSWERDCSLAVKYFPVNITIAKRGTISCDVICPLRLFTRDFRGEQLEIQLGREICPIDQQQAADFAQKEYEEEEKQRPDEQKEELPPLPDALNDWFNVDKFKDSSQRDILSLTVKETRLWQNQIGVMKSQNRLQHIHSLLGLFYLEEQNNENSEIFNEGDGYYRLYFTDAQILCHYQKASDSDERTLTLLDIDYERDGGSLKQWKDGTETWVQSVKKKYKNQDPQMFPLTKAYPGLLLYKDYYNQWRETESAEVAHLAMSDEEMTILHELTSSVDEHTSAIANMPTFINGPAGSGKSTILYYLFCHYWKYRKDKNLKEKLLFITLSKNLLENAKKVIAEILRLEPDPDNESNGDLSQEDKTLLSTSFYPFRDIMLKIVGEESSRFNPEYEIDFDAFKQLLKGKNHGDNHFPDSVYYQKGRLKQSITPELCWHVIRSYIKGYSEYSYLQPDDFPRIKNNGLFVSRENYQAVFEDVWPWYKRITSPRADLSVSTYWDQQDLAREALNKLALNDNTLPKELQNFAAIFCDEAQDLTGVELKIVQHLSTLMSYDLRYQSGIPFAFAGDPMQSLNPSGFRWDDLRACMHNLLEKLRSCRFKDYDLHYNYRCPAQITHLANLVQLFRQHIFADKIMVQEPMNPDPGNFTCYCFDKSTSEPLSPSEREHLKGSIILLPCSVDREEEFIAQYKILEQIREKDPNQVFMSVMNAKGLDIQHVIVFAFGETLFPVPLSLDKEMDDIALSYAFNKLYVAITRTKNQMLIMDTKQGYENLWEILDNPQNREKCLEKIERRAPEKRKEWEKNLPTIRINPNASITDFYKLSEEQELEQAKVLQKDGKESRNPDYLLRAANFFRRNQREEEANRCTALAYEFRREYAKAAEIYKELREFDDRERYKNCLFAAEDWSTLCTMDNALGTQEIGIAKFMAVNPATWESVEKFLSQDEYDCIPDEKTRWQNVVARLCQFGLTVSLEKIKNEPRLCNITEKLADYLVTNCSKFLNAKHIAGHLFVQLGKWEEVDSYALKDLLTGEDRKIVIANTAPWPDYVLYCSDMKQAGLDIFQRRWKEEHSYGETLDEQQKCAVCDMLKQLELKKDLQEFVTQYKYLGGWRLLSHLNFDDEIKFLETAVQTSPEPECIDDMQDKVISMVQKANELRQLLQLVGTSQRFFSKSSESAAFGAKIEDLCEKHFTFFETKDDLLRAGAVLEKIGLDKLISEFGRKYASWHERSDELKETAIRIYLRGRLLFKNRTHDESILTESRSNVQKWGYGFERLWQEASLPLLLPTLSLDGASIDEEKHGDDWFLTKSPIKIDITPEEFILRLDTNRRGCVFWIEHSNKPYQIQFEDGRKYNWGDVAIANAVKDLKIVTLAPDILELRSNKWNSSVKIHLGKYWK